MKSNILCASLLLVVGFAFSGRSEMIENGDFSDGVSGWSVNCSSHYGAPDPVFEVAGGALNGSRLHSAKSSYLSVIQAVDIRKDKRYRLSYEVKGDARGNYGVAILQVNMGKHVSKKFSVEGSDWEKVEAEFTGNYDTDQKWVRDWHKQARENQIKNGRTQSGELKNLSKEYRTDEPTLSSLSFYLGSLSGSISLRNISLVELE